ncbi:YbaK/EbsC family protein [Dactylosporangium sp. CS-033363]|uniref:YbaK/EbsC family protein n=1 Tax=unclassified Dactylosporangium TaxID=2621675 RepID=UPI003D8FAF79
MILKLDLTPALDAPALLAPPVRAALAALDGAQTVQVAAIDPELADTAAFCAAYDVTLEQSANCVIVVGKPAGVYAACVILATTRADVNGAVRRLLGTRKASFAPMDDAVGISGMEYGGITPIGLPADWPIYIDARVPSVDAAVIGSGIRGSKIVLPGSVLAALPGATVVEGLASPLTPDA